MNQTYHHRCLALIAALFACANLFAQSPPASSSFESQIRPQLWLGATANLNLAGSKFPDYAGFEAIPGSNSNQPQLRPGLDVRFSYGWLQIRTGIQPTQYNLEYMIQTSSGEGEAITRSQQFYTWNYHAVRIPLSVGLAPTWKLAPYIDGGIFVDASYHNSRSSYGNATTFTTTYNHAMGCGCWWTTHTQHDQEIPEENYAVENSFNLGLFVDLGVSYHPFSRHRFNAELRIGQSNRSIGPRKEFGHNFKTVTLGYAFNLF